MTATRRGNGRAPALLPHSIDAERALLGAMLVSERAALDGVAGVVADDYYVPKHRTIHEAMAVLVTSGRAVDVPTVLDVLSRGRLGGAEIEGPDLIELQVATGSTRNVAEYVEIVSRLAADRRQMHAATEFVEALREGDEVKASRWRTELLAPEYSARIVTGGQRGFIEGAAFILDDATESDPIWGRADEVLWQSGEEFLEVGPTGVGKTTLALQLLGGRLGLVDEVLGYPVKTTDKPILYLALDRPRQIQRAMRRIFGEDHRETLKDRLIVWRGPLPEDLGRNPEALPRLVRSTGAGTIFVDSLKDAAVKLSDDEVGGNLNRGIQLVLADGVEVAALHHQRKGQQGGGKPKTLEDVYGSTWITAGAGSVVLLWGSAGDPVVELTHLKQPKEEIGPLKVEHDHHAGRSAVYRGQVDALKFLQNAPHGGVTTIEFARVMFGGVEKPNDNQRKKAQRRLDTLVRGGLATKIEGRNSGAGNTGARYYAVDSVHEMAAS